MESWLRDHPDAWQRSKAETAELPLPGRTEPVDRWRASRVEIPSIYLDSTFQIYLVSQPRDEDGVLGIYPRSIGVPGSSGMATTYFDRVVAPDNRQEVFVVRPDLIISPQSFGTVIAAANTLFYNNTMRSLRIQKYIRDNVCPDLPTDGCSLAVETFGSQSRKVATSQINKYIRPGYLNVSDASWTLALLVSTKTAGSQSTS